MQSKYARLITTINSARSHMVKIAEDPLATKVKGYQEMQDKKLQPGTGEGAGNQPTPQTTAAGGAPRMSNPSLMDKIKGYGQFGIDYLRARPEQTMSAAISALGGGAGAYLLAKLLKRKRAWMWGLGGAALAGTGGAMYGRQLYDTVKQWLADRKAGKQQFKNTLSNANPNPSGKQGRPELFTPEP